MHAGAGTPVSRSHPAYRGQRTAEVEAQRQCLASAHIMTAIRSLPVRSSPIPARAETRAPRVVTRALTVAKEYHKFSAAHFLIFDDGTAERLHGHNYRVSARLGVDGGHGLIVDFKVLKSLIDVAIADLDERLLLPARHPELSCRRDGDSLEIRYRERRYVVPADEALLLPIGNSSVEELAQYLAERVAHALLEAAPRVADGRLELSVEETDGQRGSVTVEFGAAARDSAAS